MGATLRRFGGVDRGAHGMSGATLVDAACEECLRRTWLIGALAGAIEIALRGREHLPELLALEDRDLIAALAGDRAEAVRGAWERFDGRAARAACRAASVEPVCR